MADDEILRRLDAHLVIANEHMARGNELMAENRQAFAEHHEAMQNIRYELSQMSLRGERVAREFIVELRGQREELRRLRLEQREETRASRQALFAILDQLKGGGGPAVAGA